MMKDFFKSIYSFFELLFKTIASVFDVVVFGKLFLKKLHLENRRDSAVVLANGPSAREIIKEKPYLLRDCDVIAMNDNAISDSFTTIKPRFYILLDPAYFVTSFRSENELTDNDYNQVVEKLLNNLQNVNWDLRLFLPIMKKADKMASLFEHHAYIKVTRYNSSRLQGFPSYVMWALDNGLGVPSSKNIVIPAILQMINLGYTNIYLYGAEFSWTKSMDVDINNGMLYLNDKHFYSKDEIRYYGKSAYRMKLESIAEALKALEIVEEFALKKNIKIINRTKGSFIDAFSYQNPDNL